MSNQPRQPADILSELLVLEAQLGSEDALAQLVEIWGPSLKSRAMRLTRDDEGTLDVLQETWIGIARGMRSLKDPSRFGAWSMRIVHHKAADWIKERAKQRALRSDLRNAPLQQTTTTDRPSGRAIREAISMLDPKLRELVYLFYMDSCTLEQAALVMGIPVGTAKSRLARARTQLRNTLEQPLERSTP